MRKLWEQNRLMCILFAVILLGAAIDVAAHLQKSYPATVISVTDRTYTPARRSGRSRSSARYHATISVTYTDESGAERSGTFRYTTINQRTIPNEGDTFPVVRGLLGLTAYPDTTLRSVGIALYGPPGVVFCISLLTKLSLWRKERRESGNERGADS